MDTKIKVKDEDLLSSNTVPQNERELFTKNIIMNTNSGIVLLGGNCEEEVKTEVKSETITPDVYLENDSKLLSKHITKQDKPEIVTGSSKYGITSQKERELLSDYAVMKNEKFNTRHEMDNKIEIKQELWWCGTEASSINDDIKDGRFTPVKSPRSYTEAASGYGCGDSAFHFVEVSEGNIVSYGKDSPEYENQESDVTKVSFLEKLVQSKLAGECTNGRPHKCKFCEKSFHHLSNLRRHNLIHEGKKPHKCEICEKSFTQLSHLKRHYLIHGGKKPHKCEVCEKSFSQLSSLRLHNLKHEGKMQHKCEICKKGFIRLSDLKAHNMIHEGKEPYKCEFCPRSFAELCNFKRHNSLHENMKRHKCKVCEKSFAYLSALKTHSLIHEGNKPHKCEICEKKFLRSCHLKRHSLTHVGKKPHSCVNCDKKFAQLSSLRLHSLIHEGKKLYSCEICETSFTSLSDWKRHVLIHKSNESL